MLETGLDGLKEYIERMSDIVRESSEPDIASDFAHTLHKVSLVTAELRKAETAERKAAEAMSKADILEAVRRLPPNEREQMGREIAALGAKRSGLA